MASQGDRESSVGTTTGRGGRFSTEARGDAHVVTILRPAELDAHEVEQLGEDLLAFARPLDPPRLVVDMAPITHVSSAALSMLVTLNSHVEARGGRLCLARLGGDAVRALRLCTLDTVIDIADSVDEAVERI